MFLGAKSKGSTLVPDGQSHGVCIQRKKKKGETGRKSRRLFRAKAASSFRKRFGQEKALPRSLHASEVCHRTKWGKVISCFAFARLTTRPFRNGGTVSTPKLSGGTLTLTLTPNPNPMGKAVTGEALLVPEQPRKDKPSGVLSSNACYHRGGAVFVSKGSSFEAAPTKKKKKTLPHSKQKQIGEKLKVLPDPR